MRLAERLTLIAIFSHARKDPELQRRCVDFYLSHTDRINNWDLVDLSCYPLLGEWLLDKGRTLLYDLARDGKDIWEQRIGIVSTMTFIRHGQLDDTFAIADILLYHRHDLIQKAVGWLLREAGKRDADRLRAFLDERCAVMPRTMLRYAIKRFPDDLRRHYLSLPRQKTKSQVAALRITDRAYRPICWTHMRVLGVFCTYRPRFWTHMHGWGDNS